MTIKEYTMTGTKKSTGKIFSIVFTVALICLMTAVIIPGVNGASAVNLGSAGNYAILAKTGISTTGTTMITGNIAVSPITATAITGFGLSMDPSNQFSRSSLVTGAVYAADYAAPTPATLTAAVSSMEAAYTSAAGQTPPDATELYAGNLGGKTLAPGVYKWSTGVLIPASTTLTLDAQGNSGAVWVFQIAQDLTMNSGSQIVLANGAQVQNVYWQIGGGTGVTIGSGAHAEGTILAQKAITMNSGATLKGRALAQSAVTLIANTITAPTSTSPPAPVQTQTAATTPAQTVIPTPTVVPTPAPKYEPIPTSAPTAQKTTVSVNVGGNSGVTKVGVTGTGNKDMIVTGTENPGWDIEKAPGKVYQYVNLIPARYSTVDGAVISFSVRSQWLDDNQISPLNVVLYHLDGGTTWTALPTTMVEIEGAKVDYTATSPGLSLFAITGQKYPITATVQTAAPTVSTVAQTPVATQTTAQPTQIPTTKSPVPVWVPVTAVICTLLIMAVFSGRKGKNS